MGRRKVGFKTRRGGVDQLKNVVDSGDEGGEGADPDLDSFLDDEIDKYNEVRASDARQKVQGKQKKGKKKQVLDSDDDEQEIYGLDVSSSEEDEKDEYLSTEDVSDDEEEGSDAEDMESDDNDDDILESSKALDAEGRIPDSRAWGKRARAYHSTDYVDQDFGGFEGADAELAQQEEDEAKEIQKRLTAELDESDFLDFLPGATAESTAKPVDKGHKSKEILTLDLETLSVIDRKKLVERECPEVIHLLEEYKEKLDKAFTARRAVKEGDNLKDDPAINLRNDYLMTKYLCLLNYCVNISYFLYLRSTNPTSCKGHPVIKSILQYKRLLDELNDFKTAAKAGPKDLSALPAPKLKTRIVEKVRKRPLDQIGDDDALEATLNKKSAVEEKVEIEGAAEPLEKRGITREMAKNKGLTPKRKKEQRNPRVKHREKFRKANIRRKGQVRTARTEVKKYDGEAFGIKSHITKSIKLK